MRHDFELILEYNQPIAVIIPERIAADQLIIIYKLIPSNSINQRQLAARWNCSMVLSGDDWANQQFRRVPMLPPRGVKLAFAQ